MQRPTDKTAKAVEHFVSRWCPPSLALNPAFLEDFRELLTVAVNEAWAYVTAGLPAAVAVPGIPDDARRPPPFVGATCRGSYVLGSACGHCERCEWERNEIFR